MDVTKGCLTALGAAFGSVLLIAVLMILTTFFAGVSGWLVGMWFPYVTDTIRELSGTHLTDFQLGATLGFFGSAFRSISTNS